MKSELVVRQSGTKAREEERLPYAPDEEIPGSGLVVITPLGVGGVGVVYLAYDPGLDQRRTIKLITNKFVDRREERLREEARTLAKLRHPNIVRVVQFGVTTDAKHLPFFVMEEANGQSLEKIITQAKRVVGRNAQEPLLGFTEVLDITQELFDALAYAHEQKIIHRDIKPANIIIDRDGPVTITKLIDFGLSTKAEPSDKILGTPLYASPEQFSGLPVTPKTDLYSAGQTIYELVAGRAPFDDLYGLEDLRAAHLKAKPAHLAQVVPNTPPEFADIIMALIAKKPADRPRSARHVAEVVRSVRKEFHTRFSRPDIPLATDPGRAQSAMDPFNFEEEESGPRRPTEILAKSDNPSMLRTRDVFARKTLDLMAPTEVDAEFPWLEEIRKEHLKKRRALIGRAITRTATPPVKVYLDPDEAFALVETERQDQRIRRQKVRRNILRALVGLLVVGLFFAAFLVLRRKM